RYYLPLPTPPSYTNIENTKSTQNWFNNAKRCHIDATFSLSS
ncbi:5766_t:CDS:1, partial [Funneliformis geosporum]